MRIGIIGGWGSSPRDGFKLRGRRVEFEGFCTQLGRRLGALGQAIIVRTDEDDAADTYVVRGLIEGALSTGYAERARTKTPDQDLSLVSVFRAEEGAAPFEAERAPPRFLHHDQPPGLGGGRRQADRGPGSPGRRHHRRLPPHLLRGARSGVQRPARRG